MSGKLRRLPMVQYVVMKLDDRTLSDHRRLQVSSDLSLTDGGENADVTIGAVTTQTGAGSKIPKLDASGRLRLGVDPSNVLDAATKQYVDGIGGGSHNLLSAQHPDTTVGTVVAGDLIVGDATPKWARLAKGAAGTVLKAGASVLEWGSLAFSAITGLLADSQLASGVTTTAEANKIVKTDASGKLSRCVYGPVGSNPRVVWGRINSSDGTILGGSGDFTVAFLSTGKVTITFTTAFSAVPSTVVLVESPWLRFARIGDAPTTSTVTIWTVDNADTPSGEYFHFVTVGASL